MKKISRFVSILAILLFAVSCQRGDIDGGQIVNNGKLNLTATIVTPDATRVTYAVDNDVNHAITPSWTVGDEIIGWDDQGETFTFTVSAVDAGRATLDAGTYVPGSATKLYAIYAPGKTVSSFEGSGSARTLAIDLSAQNGVLDDDSPVLMCATAEITAGSASLAFTNQTAIVGITKFKVSDANAVVEQLSLSGVIAKGTFEVSGENLVLTPNASPATLNIDGSWTADASGKVTTALYFAALPTASASLRLDASSATKTYSNAAAIPTTSIVAGNYYHMAKNLTEHEAAIGATTYATIGDAWAVANASTEPITVTLLNDCTAAAQLALNNTGTGAVTLNLNNKILTTVSNNHGISIGESRSLTVSNDGTIKNVGAASSEKYVIYNEGTLTINNGTITSDYRAIRSSGTATVNDGTIESTNSVTNAYAFYNTGALAVTGGEFQAKRFPLFNTESSSTATISGGVFSSTYTASGGAAVRAYNGTVTITGGLFSMEYSGGELFTISSGKVYVTGGYFDRPIPSNMTRTALSGGSYTPGRNAANTDAATKIQYPYTAATGTTYYQTNLKGQTYSYSGLPAAKIHANTAADDITIILMRASNISSSYDLTNINNHTITLDLNGNTINTTAESFITTSGKLTITSTSAGGTISSTKNNVIDVTDAGSDVTISDCTITSSCAAGSYNYSVRTIHQTNGTLSIENAVVISENASALYSGGGTMMISGSTITSNTYGLYASNNADITLSGTDNSFYSAAGRCVYAYASTVSITLEGGYYYSADGNAISCRNATEGASSYSITGGFFSLVNSNLSKSSGYDNIVKLATPEPHDHGTTHTGLSYDYGYQPGEGEASLDEPVASYGGAQTGINF